MAEGKKTRVFDVTDLHNTSVQISNRVRDAKLEEIRSIQKKLNKKSQFVESRLDKKKLQEKYEKEEEIQLETENLKNAERGTIAGITILTQEKDLEEEEEKTYKIHAEIAKERQKLEELQAENYAQRRVQQLANVEKTINHALERDLNIIQQAQIYSDKARNRMHEQQLKDEQKDQYKQQRHEQDQETKMRRILELKKDMDRASQGFKENRLLILKQQAERQEKFEKEHDSIVAMGENPYEIYRRRDMANQREKQRRDLMKRLEDAKEKIRIDTEKDGISYAQRRVQ
ncbi:MAG: hypothetical protein EZS28_027352, partial [Streblomastix strix]